MYWGLGANRPGRRGVTRTRKAFAPASKAGPLPFTDLLLDKSDGRGSNSLEIISKPSPDWVPTIPTYRHFIFILYHSSFILSNILLFIYFKSHKSRATKSNNSFSTNIDKPISAICKPMQLKFSNF